MADLETGVKAGNRDVAFMGFKYISDDSEF